MRSSKFRKKREKIDKIDRLYQGRIQTPHTWHFFRIHFYHRFFVQFHISSIYFDKLSVICHWFHSTRICIFCLKRMNALFFFLYRCKPLKKMSVETPEARSASSAICFDTVQKHHWISVWRLLQVIAVCEWLFWVCVCEPDNLHRKFHKNNDNFDKVILITKCVNKYLWSSVVNFVWCYHAANIDIRKSIRILLDFLTLISWDDGKDKRWTEISRWKKWV